MDLNLLEGLMEQYMKTLDDQEAVESFTTQREYARTELIPFLKWLEATEEPRSTAIVQNWINLFGGRVS